MTSISYPAKGTTNLSQSRDPVLDAYVAFMAGFLGVMIAIGLPALWWWAMTGKIYW